MRPIAIGALLMLAAQAGCISPPGEAARVDRLLARLDTRGRAAQVVAITISVGPSSADSVAARLAGLGGAWIEGGDAASIRQLHDALDARPGLPALILADVSEGLGRNVAGTTRYPSVYEVLASAPGEDIETLGRTLAEEAVAAGIRVGLVDLPPTEGGGVYARGEALELPDRVARLLEGADRAGLPLAVRLFWSADSSGTSSRWDRARLDAIELAMLQAADRAVGLIPGTLSLPALAGDTTALPYSASGLAVLRTELGWERPILVDLRDVPAGTAGARAVRAIAAGADLVVVRSTAGEIVTAIERALLTGELTHSRLEEAARRVLRLKLTDAARSTHGAGERVPAFSPEAAELAARLERWVSPRGPLAEDSIAGEGVRRGDYTLRLVEPVEVGMSEAGLAEVDEAILEAIDDSVFTAAAVVIARRGGMVRFRGYAADAALAVDPEKTLFDLASLTKVVGTTTAAALLIDAGELSLDAPVARYVPEFSGDGRDEVTVRQLLTHTSGLPAGRWLYGSAISPEEAIAQVLRQPLSRDPGEAMEYSDLGMILLAEVIERAAGRPIDQFLAARLFAPLDMASTMYLPPAYLHEATVPTALETERPFPLQAVVHDGNAFRLGGIAGHAGLFSTARDLAIFSQMMLNRGSYGSARILSPALVDTLTSRQTDADGRALGWDTPAERSSAGRYFSSRSYGHTGYTGTSIWIDPLRELFVVLLTNRTYTNASPRDILDLRVAVHEAAVRSISEFEISRRRNAR